MEFKTTKRIDSWIKEHCKFCHSHATAGEHFEFIFLPTGIVECQTVRCIICKEELTDYI